MSSYNKTARLNERMKTARLNEQMKTVRLNGRMKTAKTYKTEKLDEQEIQILRSHIRVL